MEGSPSQHPLRSEQWTAVAISLAKLMRRKSLGGAALAARMMLQAGDDDWRVAISVLQKISARAGRDELAAAYAHAAGLQTADEARAILSSWKSGVCAPITFGQDDNHRNIIAAAWGAGFWSDVGHVMGCALLAEISGRRLVPYWGRHSLYGDGSSADAFSFYFKRADSPLAFIDDMASRYHGPKTRRKAPMPQVIAIAETAVDVMLASVNSLVCDRYIGVADAVAWLPAGLWPCPTVTEQVYRDLIRRHLQPTPTVVNAVDKFIGKELSDTPFTAIHLRGTDKLNEQPNLAAVNKEIIQRLIEADDGGKIFLLSDDGLLARHVKTLFPGRVFMTRAHRSRSSLPIHTTSSHGSTTMRWTRTSLASGHRNGLEIMVDTYIAARATRFFGNGRSNVAAHIALLRDWEGHCHLVASNQLLEVADWGIVRLT